MHQRQPIGPAAPVPANAVRIAFDMTGAVYYRLGILIWRLKDQQWSIYGYKDEWPEPLDKRLIPSYHALNSVYKEV